MLLKELLDNLSDEKENIDIKGITCDSRKVEKDFIYVCIVGAVNDGHNFAESAVKNGAAVVLTERDLGIKEQIIVEDTHKEYALLSAKWFSNPSERMKLIGVTGTNGKTSITTMLKSVLEKAGHKVGLIGTIHNMIGDKIIETERTTPDCYELNRLFKEMADDGCTAVVMEVSSHALDQKRVYGINFEVAVFTNLTRDHLDYHKTMDNYLLAKKKLFSMCKTAVINKDDSYADTLIDGLNCKIDTVSVNGKGDWYATDTLYRADGVSFSLNGKENMGINVSTGGKFTVYNTMLVCAAAYNFGINKDIIETALNSSEGIKGRAEVVPTNRDFTVIIDYAHTPDGLENILLTFKECKKGRLVTLFGCGGDRDKTKRPIMGKIAATLSDFVIVTSDNPRTEEPSEIIKDILVGMKETKCAYKVIENRIEAINYAILNAQKDDVIILAGKGHETYQILKDKTIHLDEREIVKDALYKRKDEK